MLNPLGIQPTEAKDADLKFSWYRVFKLFSVGLFIFTTIFICTGNRNLILADRVVSFVDPADTAKRVASTVSDPALLYVSAVSADYEISASCTGFRISANVAVTAAHCLYPSNAEAADSIVVYPGVFYDGMERMPHGGCSVTSWKVPPQYVPSDADKVSWEETRWDLAVLYLDSCDFQGKGYSTDTVKGIDYFTLGAMPAGSEVVHSANYPGDELEMTLIEEEGVVLKCFTCEKFALMRTNLDVSQGSSGGPVWANVDGKRQVVGIIVTTGSLGTHLREVDADFLNFVTEATELP